ncbi:YqgE/AlgH family protein [Paralimibaculum aggregatum]|nr:YqgE/AlgH family protein [Limibaculum sp. NKW23]
MTGPETGPAVRTDFLAGQLLIAMPGMQDPRFHKTVVYLCAHSDDGAMGLIVNKPAETLALKDLFERLSIPATGEIATERVRFGGPVETGRGFVLHSADYHSENATLKVDDETSMTATLDILHAMAEDQGPERAMVALGYSGWAPGQLEAEIQRNGWLYCAPDEELLFDADNETKWTRAMAKIGVDPALLSTGGRA